MMEIEMFIVTLSSSEVEGRPLHTPYDGMFFNLVARAIKTPT